MASEVVDFVVMLLDRLANAAVLTRLLVANADDTFTFASEVRKNEIEEIFMMRPL